jgi:hypothetical protein
MHCLPFCFVECLAAQPEYCHLLEKETSWKTVPKMTFSQNQASLDRNAILGPTPIVLPTPKGYSSGRVLSDAKITGYHQLGFQTLASFQDPATIQVPAGRSLRKEGEAK